MIETRRTFSPMGLDAFLAGTTRYARWITPIDPALRRVGRVAAATSAVACVVWLSYPIVMSWAAEGFFIVGETLVQIGLVLRTPAILLAVASAVAYGFIYVRTESLSVGSPGWHNALYGVVLAGALHVSLLGFLALVIATNVVIWVLIAIATLFVLIMVLGAGAAASRR